MCETMHAPGRKDRKKHIQTRKVDDWNDKFDIKAENGKINFKRFREILDRQLNFF